MGKKALLDGGVVGLLSTVGTAVQIVQMKCGVGQVPEARDVNLQCCDLSSDQTDS